MKELIKSLVETYGPSGREEQVRALIETKIGGHVDEMRTDAMGNLIALKRGDGTGKRIMVSAHMDELGVVVTHIDEKGFVRFGTLGGVFPQTLMAARVRFADGTIGVVSWEKWIDPAHLPASTEWFIDFGATSKDDVPVGVGDMGCFDRDFCDLGKRLVSKAMDDRIACAIQVQTLLEMDATPNDVYFVFSTQEELGTRGATVSAFGIEPEIGLAVDVTKTGDTPKALPMAVSLGDGPAIKVMDRGSIAHPAVKNWMIDTAERIGVPHQLEVLEAGGTDARAIQLSRAGVPVGCLSIPCRHLHSPSEMVDYDDVLNSVKLLKALLTQPVSL